MQVKVVVEIRFERFGFDQATPVLSKSTNANCGSKETGSQKRPAGDANPTNGSCREECVDNAIFSDPTMAGAGSGAR